MPRRLREEPMETARQIIELFAWGSLVVMVLAAAALFLAVAIDLTRR